MIRFSDPTGHFINFQMWGPEIISAPLPHDFWWSHKLVARPVANPPKLIQPLTPSTEIRTIAIAFAGSFFAIRIDSRMVPIASGEESGKALSCTTHSISKILAAHVLSSRLL